ARSLTGAFSSEIHAAVDALIELRMFSEATLDFPDEDVEFIRAADAAGKLGIERTLSAIARADLALIVTDAREPDHPADAAIAARLPAALPRIVVRNKIDLAGLEASPMGNDRASEVWLSALSGAGVEALREVILV